MYDYDFRARTANAKEADPDVLNEGDELLIHMKHGDWWSEIKRGVPLTVTEAGKVGGKVRFKEKYDIMRSDKGMEAKVERAKGGMFKLVLLNDPFRRALTVKRKED